MNDKPTMTEHRDCRCGWTLPRDMKITVSASDPETTAALTFSCPVCGRSGGIQTTKTVIPVYE
jgi:DNA gyrase inhibitor GyrI